MELLWMLWMWTLLAGCWAQAAPEEVELFNYVKQSQVPWISEPPIAWVVIKLTSNEILQGCHTGAASRTLLSPWIENGEAHLLLLDISFALEQESAQPTKPLEIYLFASERRLTRFSRNVAATHRLAASNPFPVTASSAHIERHASTKRSIPLGSVGTKGFHVGFAYSGSCAFITSVRLYYRRCPGRVAGLARFPVTVAGSPDPLELQCVEGAASAEEWHAPEATCSEDGAWVDLHRECVCLPGHERAGEVCTACRVDYYKPANESGCRRCPPNSGTERAAAVECDCLTGYDRLPFDPRSQGCTRPPSNPQNVIVHHHGDSHLTARWNPPHDLGGRQAAELTYSAACSEKEMGDHADSWATCGGGVAFSPNATGLVGTEVNVTGLSDRRDYRLVVTAANALGRSSERAAVTFHGRIVLETHQMQSTQGVPFQWLLIGAVMGSLLLVALVLTVVFSLRRAAAKQTSDQQRELMPCNPSVSFGRFDAQPQSRPDLGIAIPWLRAHDDLLLANLRDTLVDRSRLTLGKQLGKGEFGAVYEGLLAAEDGGVDIKVAVKTIRGIHSADDLQNFVREAELMKDFDHDNVVKLLGVTMDGEEGSVLSVPLVILPFMKHGDLRRFLIATRYGDVPIFVPQQSLLRFMVDIATGMEYVSSRGFLHRDLAARNCMLGDSFRVCVADFGLSKQINSSEYYRQQTTVRVPVKWMAPESLSESVYTTKSDVWSFGVTMWEIASRGRNPFSGVQNHDLLDLLIRGQRLKKPEGCEDELYETIRTCWHHDPAQRPGFAALVSRLKELLSLLPPLEASEETTYINQGLEAAASAHHCDPEPGYEDADRAAPGNVYMEAQSARRVKQEEGSYLMPDAFRFVAEGDPKS